MAWIELHQSLRTHPKVTRLATKLGIHRAHAMGLLANLWLWAVDYALEGRLNGYSSAELSDACLWQGDSEALVEALVQSLWINKSEHGLEIHDWSDYGAKHLIKSRLRVKKWRKEQKRLSNVTDKEQKRYSTHIPYHTLPSTIKDGTAKSLRAFMQHFTQTLKNKTGVEADVRLIRKAYGKAVGYLKAYPHEQTALSAEMDRTPEKMPQAWYVAFLCGQIQQRTHEKLKGLLDPIAKQ